ncbi:TolC family outer membrane protein [Taklimakanibacter deserti]|uniref:TolC family outer membrane protein n=1 Tax=Taklimakanibacter deserti TaxID=2267839 RepID=UPI000E64A928
MPHAVSATSLRDAVKAAVSTHPSVEASRAALRSSAWEILQARSRLLPTVDLRGNAGPNIVDQPEGFSPDVNSEWRLQREIALTVRQILYDGGDRINDVYRSAARADAFSLRVSDQAEKMGLDAVEAYLDVRRHSAIRILARQNRQRLGAILVLVRDKTTGGSAPKSDLEQARERIAAADFTIAQIDQALEEARARYRQVIGSEPTNLTPVAFPGGVPKTRAAAVASAIESNPAILALDAETRAAEFALAQAKAGYYPTISLEGIASTGDDIAGTPGPSSSLTGQVTMSWNLYQGGGTTYRKRALGEKVNQAQADRRVKAREISETVDRAFAAYTVGARRVAAARNQAAATASVVAAYQEEYKLAKRSLLDLLDAENARFTSQFQLTSADAVHRFAAYQLLASMNRLLKTLGIRPPVEARSNFLEQSQGGVFSIDIEPLRQ